MNVEKVTVWDKNHESNRTTRKSGELLGAAYGDSKLDGEEIPISDLEYFTGEPWLMACVDHSGKVSVNVKSAFSPSDIGDKVLWKVESYRGLVAGDSQGNFSDGGTVNIELVPDTSTKTRPDHKDFSITIGLDQNGNGTFDEGEAVDGLTFNVKAISKNEYDYCFDSMNGWAENLAFLVYPDAAENYYIFLDTNWFGAYSRTEVDKLTSVGIADMKKGLGMDYANHKQGKIDWYIWESNTAYSERIRRNDTFMDTILIGAIKSLQIKSWYENNAGNSNEFTTSFSARCIFLDTNLNLALGEVHPTINLTVGTERGNGDGPVISYIELNSGSCDDVWDFKGTDIYDSHAGWASRVQIGYRSSEGRTAGKIFRQVIDLKTSYLGLQSLNILHSNYATLKAKWGNHVLYGDLDI